MVEEIQKVVTEYEQRLRRTPIAPRLSYGRRMLAEDHGPNTMFFTVLFCDEAMALEFLQDVGFASVPYLCSRSLYASESGKKSNESDCTCSYTVLRMKCDNALVVV